MMTDILCGYTGDREAMLVAYLYDEIPPADRALFETHLATCARCRTELTGLGGVRDELARWSPPEPGFAVGGRHLRGSDGLHGTGAIHDSSDIAARDARMAGPEAGRGAWWRMPVWAQVAAAMLVLGVSAGIANLDVRYDQHGLTVRTGWSRPAPTPPPSASTALPSASDRAPSASALGPSGSGSPRVAPWRADLTELEQQLRREFHPAQVGTSSAIPAVARAASANDADLLRRMKALVDESERRQERELALRVAEVVRDLNVQRQADLRKIDQNLGIIQDRTGVEVLKNRQMIDYYIQRASQRQ